MTYESALHTFWSDFGVDAYVQGNVPTDVKFPYLVYERVYPSPYETAAGVVNLYYYTESEKEVNAKAREIRKALGEQIHHDDGTTWLVLGSPAQLNLANNDNNMIKQRQINVSYTFYAKEI